MKSFKIIVFSITLVSCSEPAAVNETDKLLVQSCDSCDWREMILHYTQGGQTDSMIISVPTVIEFFRLANDAELRSSVAAVNNYGMNWCYEMMDQKGIYDTQIVPALPKSVTRIDTIQPVEIIKFICGDDHYTIDMRPFAVHDGALMFSPGSEPVFWQESAMRMNCTEATFVKCYFETK